MTEIPRTTQSVRWKGHTEPAQEEAGPRGCSLSRIIQLAKWALDQNPSSLCPWQVPPQPRAGSMDTFQTNASTEPHLCTQHADLWKEPSFPSL